MNKKTTLQALFISTMLVLTGCGAANEKVEPETELQTKDENRTEIQQVENSPYRSIVRIEQPGEKGHGTGFLIGQNKLLTNKHVADSFDENKMIVRLKNDDSETTDFKVKKVTLYSNEDADLALIEVSPTVEGQSIDDYAQNFELASLAEIERVKEGDLVHTIGYPGDKKEGSLWVSKGKVLMLGGNFLTYDAFISGGNSGSPLFNEDGKVIGLSNASNDETEENITSYGFLLTEELYSFVENNQ